MVLFQVGSVAITANSLPALIAVPVFVLIGLWLSVKNRLFGMRDVALLCGVSALQLIMLPLVTSVYINQLSIFILAWPIIAFMSGYGAWRLSGRRPLQNWPWYRVGLLITLQMLAVDISAAFLIPPAFGKIWQLGGAGMLDALVLGPPVLTLAFYGLLDCRSPLVFCSRGCRSAGRCLHGITEMNPSAAKTLPLTTIKRVGLSVLLAFVVFVVHAGFCQQDAKPKKLIPVPLVVSLNDFIGSMADKYRIEPPNLMSSGEDTIAFTRKTNDGAHVEIILGTQFAARGDLSENTANARTVIAHEFGHAILYARDQGFPALLIIGFYVITLAALLFVAPTRKGILIAGALLFVILAAMSLLFGKNTHAAIKTVCLGTTTAGVLIAMFWKEIAPCLKAAGNHLPDRFSVLVAGIAASAILFLVMPVIGAFNSERELFADKIAACEVGQTSIIQVLNLLHPNSRSQIEEWLLDPFHPAPSLRIGSLSSLDKADLESFCQKAQAQ